MNYLWRSAILAVGAFTASCGGSTRENERELNQFIDNHPAVSEATWQGTGTLECHPASLDSCGANGCERGNVPGTFVRWTPATRTYQRCDRNGCDSYPAQVSYSGSWANITLPNNGVMTRLTGRNAYAELVTQMDGVMIYRGQCQPVR